VLGGIPQPKRGQFDTPERVLGFLVETLASRDIAESLAAFPIVEQAERVTLKDRLEFTYHFSPAAHPLDDDPYARLNDAAFPVVEQFEQVRLKDYQEYTGGFSPRNYPVDDAAYGRLSYSLNYYLAVYRGVSLRILTNDTSSVRSLPPGSDLSGLLHEFDGSRLKALDVTSIKELRPEARPQPNTVDRAMGVMEKRWFSATIALDQRTVELTGFVGRIADNWRVLSVALGP
jgi:hypothetical protein